MTDRPQLVYLAHPLGPTEPGNAPAQVRANAARARRWLAWLIARELDTVFVANWLTYVDVLDDGSAAHRDRGIRDGLALTWFCDGIVLVGGRISLGMRAELEAVAGAGGWVADLTYLGEEPPATRDDLPFEARLFTPLIYGRHCWRETSRRWVQEMAKRPSPPPSPLPPDTTTTTLRDLLDSPVMSLALVGERCQCTHEAGDSDCPIHPTDPETGDPIGTWRLQR